MPNVISPDGSIRQDNWVVVPRPAEGESLDIPADDKARLKAMRPHDYVGNAPEQARAIRGTQG